MALVDFNGYPYSSRHYSYLGAAGSKDGIMIGDEYWIIKYPKSTSSMNVDDISYTTSPLSEYIGSHIYEILGYDVHKTVLGIRNNKLVVGCKDFQKSFGDLKEMRGIKNGYSDALEQNLLTVSWPDSGETHHVNLEELYVHFCYNPVLIETPGVKERFCDLAVIDGLINNNDRNNGNWGILIEDGSPCPRIAPIYDNGACFSNKASENRLALLLNNPNRLESSSLNTDTVFSLNGKQILFRNVFQAFSDIGLSHEVTESLIKNYDLIESRFSDIKEFISDIPEEEDGMLVCSPQRKEVYIKSMEYRMERIITPAFQKALRGEYLDSALTNKASKLK